MKMLIFHLLLVSSLALIVRGADAMYWKCYPDVANPPCERDCNIDRNSATCMATCMNFPDKPYCLNNNSSVGGDDCADVPNVLPDNDDDIGDYVGLISPEGDEEFGPVIGSDNDDTDPVLY